MTFYLKIHELTSSNIIAQSALSLDTYRLCPASQITVPGCSTGSGSGVGSDFSGGLSFPFGSWLLEFCCRFLFLISRNASSISSSRRCRSFLWAPVEYFIFRRARPGGGKTHWLRCFLQFKHGSCLSHLIFFSAQLWQDRVLSVGAGSVDASFSSSDITILDYGNSCFLVARGVK
jgi:hypothetical protein